MKNIKITALGQVGFLFEFFETKFLIDPYLSDYVADKYGDRFKRLIEPGVSIDQLPKIDYILITHAHEDHCDPVSLKAILRNNPEVACVCTFDCISIFEEHNIDFEKILIPKPSTKFLINYLEFKVIPSRHTEIELNESGMSRFNGYIFNLNGTTFYHPGDTVPFELSTHEDEIDYAFLPINERNYFRDREGIVGNMTCREAILWSMENKFKNLIPTHWDTFKNNSTNKREFDLIALDMGFSDYLWLETGNTLEL